MVWIVQQRWVVFVPRKINKLSTKNVVLLKKLFDRVRNYQRRNRRVRKINPVTGDSYAEIWVDHETRIPLCVIQEMHKKLKKLRPIYDSYEIHRNGRAISFYTHDEIIQSWAT